MKVNHRDRASWLGGGERGRGRVSPWRCPAVDGSPLRECSPKPSLASADRRFSAYLHSSTNSSALRGTLRFGLLGGL